MAQSPDVNADRDEGGEYGFYESLPPLVQAAERGDLDTVRALLAQGNAVDEASADGWTALHAAAARDRPAIVRLLLDAGAPVDARAPVGMSVLLDWAAEGSTIARALLAEIPDSEGFTPLLNAAAAGPDVVRMLLAAGADPMAEDGLHGWRPLDRFAEYGNAPAVELLIEAGVDVNARSRSGYTALMAAAEKNGIECIRLLLRAGADPSLRYESGETAAEMAVERGHHEAAALINGVHGDRA